MTTASTNWAGNVTFRARRGHRPTSIPELQRLVAGSRRIRALGSGHSFNRIADTTGDLVTVAGLPEVLEIDTDRRTISVSGGLTYGRVGRHLQASGFALANTGSLPHISVAGACSTGTHGSGVDQRNLAAMVSGVDMVTADGSLVSLGREADGDALSGSVLSLGALGIITGLTLDIVPTFEVRQDVWDGLTRDSFDQHFDDIMTSGYSVSIFADFRPDGPHQVWRKSIEPAGPAAPSRWGATLAATPRHPVPGMPTENATAQLGVPGPWNERLPHFRLEFTPSNGDEIQSEYLLARSDAVAARRALDDIADRVADVLIIAEFRTVAADNLWISPSYHRDTAAFHFTWLPDEGALRPVLTAIEERLAPFAARPHWGKVFTTEPGVIDTLYSRLPDFRARVDEFDPTGKFGNELMDRLVMHRA